MPQYPHGRPHTAGMLSYGRGAVVAEPGGSRRRAEATAGGAVVAARGRRRGRQQRPPLAAGRAKDRSAVLRDFPTWLPAACLRQF